jgi:hypothetical protein
MRARTLWLLSTMATTVVVVTAVLAGPARHRVIVTGPLANGSLATEPCPARALAVLRDWDRRRERAWARGDPAALTRLYVVRSRTARRDRAMLAAYRSRGLRVRSMDRQVLRVHLLTCRSRRISFLLTDRLVGAVAVGHGHRTGLPAGQPVTRRVELRREAGSWRVREIYAR